jgi:hypothetical protein
MKRYVREMSRDERSAYRLWQAGWIFIYAAVGLGLIALSDSLPTRDVEVTMRLPDTSR